MDRTKLLSSARELFYKYGIKSVSMDDIARLLGVSKKTIYNHIDNKRDLVISVIREFIEEEQEVVRSITSKSENAIDEMVSIAGYVLQTVRKINPSLTYDLKKYHPAAWQLIENNHYSHIQGVIEQNIKRGIAEGLYRVDVDPEICARLYIAMAHAVFSPDHVPHPDTNFPLLYNHIMSYHLHGVMNDDGRNSYKTYLKNLDA